MADEAGTTIGVRDVDIARREFFMGDWVRLLPFFTKPCYIADKRMKVHEAVSVHEGTRVANAVAQFNQASYQANMRHA